MRGCLRGACWEHFLVVLLWGIVLVLWCCSWRGFGAEWVALCHSRQVCLGCLGLGPVALGGLICRLDRGEEVR